MVIFTMQPTIVLEVFYLFRVVLISPSLQLELQICFYLFVYLLFQEKGFP